MKKVTKKRVSTVLALAMASSMTLSAAGSVSASEAGNYWELLDSVTDTSELPDWTGDTLEVTIWVAGGTDALFDAISDTNVTFKELERVTGVKFNLEDSYGNNGDTIDAKMPKLIASGDLPTMVYSWNTDSQMAELWEHGYLADLTEYYENGSLSHLQHWAPTELLHDSYYSSMHDEEGNYYLVPNAAGSALTYYESIGYAPEEFELEYYNMYGSTPSNAAGFPTNYTVFVRDDILQSLYPDALTMDDIKALYLENGEFTEEQIFDLPLESSEDFFNLLRDMKEELAAGEYVGLDGNALEVTYGPNADTDNWDWLNYLPAFVDGNQAGVDYFLTASREETDSTQLFELSYKTDKMISFMKGLNELVNEDVVSQNSLVDNAATFNEKLLNGHYAVVYGGAAASNQIWAVEDEESSWSYRPIWVKNIDETYGGLVSGATPSYWGIFKDSVTDEQLEQLVHCIDYLNSTVGTNNFLWGPASAGLFEEDADGNRTYTDADVEACMIKGEDNDAAVKYGLYCVSVSEPSYANTLLKLSGGVSLLAPKYLAASSLDRVESNAMKYYNPGTLEGWSKLENSDLIKTNCTLYGFGVTNAEGMEQFWAARTGFENKLKKVIAGSTENFDQELNNVIQYAEENGLTEEAVLEFNEKFAEANKTELSKIGIE